MKKPVLRCCKNPPIKLVTYQTGSQYYVCKKCIDYDFWARGIISKKKLPDIMTKIWNNKNE